ncbi:hypothetical protein BRR69_12365 [Salmonella enterica]|nr:hypothetical protein [Salmonella enterica]
MKLNHIKLIAVVIALSCGSVSASVISQADNLGAKALQAQHTAAQAAHFSDMARNSYNKASPANRSVAAQAAADAQSIADKAQDAANVASHAAAVASMQQAMNNAPVASQDPAKSAAMSLANTMGAKTVTASTLASTPVASQNPAVSAAMSTANIQGAISTSAPRSTPVASQDPAVSAAMSTANVAGAAMVAGQPQNTMIAGVKNNPTGTPGNFTAQAVSTAPANSTINQAAGSLNPNTPVSVSINGQTVQTTAGAIAAVNPQAQIQTPINSVFAAAPRKGGNNHGDRNSRSEHGTGNGGNNAANSNSAHGLGGGNHIGGGSAQSGSRNVGKW